MGDGRYPSLRPPRGPHARDGGARPRLPLLGGVGGLQRRRIPAGPVDPDPRGSCRPGSGGPFLVTPVLPGTGQPPRENSPTIAEGSLERGQCDRLQRVVVPQGTEGAIGRAPARRCVLPSSRRSE